MTPRNPLRPDIDADYAADLAQYFAHHPDVPVNRARIGIASRVTVTTPEIDPDEEPYGDTAAWRPRPSLPRLILHALALAFTVKYRRLVADL